MNNSVYTMEIAGLKRDLPLCKVNDNLYIAAFIMFGDVEITVAAAKELLKLAPEHDIIITAESKGIPLAYEMARQSGSNNYIVARDYNDASAIPLPWRRRPACHKRQTCSHC